jgi:hypothetical protein
MLELVVAYVDLCLLHEQKLKAVLIELKSSEKEGDIQRDANKALEQMLHCTRTIEIRKVFRRIALFENVASLPFTSVHTSKGAQFSRSVGRKR